MRGLALLLLLCGCDPAEPPGARLDRDPDAGAIPEDAGGEAPLEPEADAGYADCLGRCAGDLSCCENAFGTGVRGCSDTSLDAANCGACGNACGPGRSCVEGRCECPGDMECADECVDLFWDPTHCGACGTSCGGDLPFCWILACRSCEGTGGLQCGDACHRVLEEEEHCGACDAPCGEGEACIRGVCTPGTCPAPCPANEVCCGGAWGADGEGCTNLDADRANCGACGNACAEGDRCVRGECIRPTCDERCNFGEVCCQSAWGGESGCTSVEWDVGNCGGCGVACEAGQVCAYGRCVEP